MGLGVGRLCRKVHGRPRPAVKSGPTGSTAPALALWLTGHAHNVTHAGQGINSLSPATKSILRLHAQLKEKMSIAPYYVQANKLKYTLGADSDLVVGEVVEENGGHVIHIRTHNAESSIAAYPRSISRTAASQRHQA